MSHAAGIDTWSPCWYVRDETAGRQLDELATVRARRGALLPAPIHGHRVGWNEAAQLLYAEGHPCGKGQLLSPDLLPEALRDLRGALLAEGVPVPDGVFRDGSAILRTEDRGGFAGVRRWDATVDLDAGTKVRGLAILAGVAAVATTIPRAVADVWYAKDGTGTVETVYLRGCAGERVLGRWYDKGLESHGPGQRGERIRGEDQRRYPKGHRRDVDELTAGYVREKFRERFLPLWKATKGVTALSTIGVVEKLAELADADELTERRLERLAGYAVVSRLGRHVVNAKGERDRVARERRAELRELGVVIADGATEEVEVDLHEVLEQALDGASWGAQG